MTFYFLVLMIMSMVSFCMMVLYYLNFMLSLQILSFCGKIWSLSMKFKYVTMLTLLMLLMCYTYVCEYNKHYFSGELAGCEVSSIMNLFVCIMASLVCTGDFLLTLMFWEYLGAVSYFLILFYGSFLNLRSSIMTLVSSRFGDVSLFILICMAGYTLNVLVPALLLMFFIVFSKSASFPFMSWLLEAMRAPTPVSSLVHSSTLVAAGVWFILRYDVFNYFNNFFLFGLILLMTMFISGVCCFFFVDLKKIIALSTCNNMAWCVFYLIFGDVMLSLFQLISHGVSKCMLFMLAGDMMSGSSGSQSSNCIYSSSLYSNWSVFSLFAVVLGLSGAPFIGVFFTKHLLLTHFMGVTNMIMYMFMLLCVFLSYLYSFRLCSIMINKKSSMATGVLYFFNSGLMTYVWLLVNYFMALSLDEEKFLGSTTSMMILMFQFICCCTSYFFYKKTIFSEWSSKLFGCNNMVELFYQIFLLLFMMTRVFVYRWDSFLLSLFSKFGKQAINVYKAKILKLMVMSIFMILMCFYMLY